MHTCLPVGWAWRRYTDVAALVSATCALALIAAAPASASVIPNDPAFSLQWGEENTGQPIITQTPQKVTEFLTALGIGRYGVLALIMLMYLVLGCLMDAMAMIILTVPIIFPVITALGFDPIWFGVIIVMTVELGLIHPPVGMNIFVIKSVVEDVKISTIFYGVLPFIVTDIVRLIILIAFPAIALYLPSKM